MRVRAWWTTAVLAGVAVACGDQPTEVVPERQEAVSGGQMTRGPGFIALATASSDDGLSISTDKDDYQPGDTVWFTGAGWPANDTLDILLEDEPATHEPHTWWVPVGEDGTFRDSTYVVDVGDLGVTFTLTATSRTTERWLVVTFTDGTLSMTSATPTPFSPNQASSLGLKDLITVTVAAANTGSASNDVRVRVRLGPSSGSPGSQALIREFTVGNLANGTSTSVDWDGKNNASAFVTDGIYTVRVSNGAGTEDNGDPRKRQIVLDNTNPTPAVNAIATGTEDVEMTITGTASDLPAVTGAGLEKVEVTIRRASDNAVLESGLATNTGTNFSTWSFNYTPTEASPQKANATATDNAGNHATSADQAFTVASTDEAPPVIVCDVPDQSMWYDDDVTVHCTASDEGSGLQNPTDDASFSLVTNVAANTDTDDAQTNSRQVCDTEDNCATAGPYQFKVDKKAPEVLCGTADGLWHATDVLIHCTATDGGSGLANSADASFDLTTNVDPGTETNNASTDSRAVADGVGNNTTAGPISGNQVDKKGPTVSLVCPASPVILGSTAAANWTASDGGSGVATGASGSVPLNTSSVGSKTASAAAGSSVDNVGNESPEATCNYSVIYLWTGFFQPVDNSNLNVAKAGSAIPVKFNLNGYQGLGIFFVGDSNAYPNSSKVNCAAIDEDLDTIEETVNAGGSSLTYDLAAQQYVYVWKSDKAWAGTCRRLDVKLNDGTTHSAYFKWMK